MRPDRTTAELHEDFARLYGAQSETGDRDPDALVLKHLYKGTLAAWDGVEQLRFTMLYMSVQQLGTAAWLWSRTEDFLQASRLVGDGVGVLCGSERRAHSEGGRLAKHLLHLHTVEQNFGGLDEYLLRELDLTPDAAAGNWYAVRRRIEHLFGNGEWAGGRTLTLLANVHDWPLRQPTPNNGDLRQRKVMRLLYPHLPASYTPNSKTFDQYDNASEMLLADLTFRNLMPDRIALAQTLRAFEQMTRGRYHVGRRIDNQLFDLQRVVAQGAERDALYGPLLEIRSEVFPEALLGEHADPPRTEPDAAADRVYLETGRIDVP